MQYDVLGRTISRTDANNAVTTYEYVNSGPGLNLLKKVSDPNGSSKEYTYDNFNRLTQTKEIIGSEQFSFNYTYDEFDNLTSITYPSGLTIKKQYDANGYLDKVTNQDGTVNIFTTDARNAYGTYTEYILSNGVKTTTTFDKYGFPTQIKAPNIQELNLVFDIAKGNLSSREDALRGVKENFIYDNLNRLTGAVLDQTSPSDAGTYTYHTEKTNAVVSIKSPANISANEQKISYTSFNKVDKITEGGYELQFNYGPEQTRKKTELKYQGNTKKTIYFSDNFEKIITGGNTYEVSYISCGAGLVAINVKENGGSDMLHYVYTDHLGSILALIDASGNIEYEQNFDVWGRERNPNDWTYTANTGTKPEWLIRGYIGHEHLPEFKLINMNGRVYDPLVGRMLSADNFVQNPFGT